jgi:hypothetical protein
VVPFARQQFGDALANTASGTGDEGDSFLSGFTHVC